MTMTVMRASADQRSRTKTEEGLRLKAYLDTLKIWTIAWGHAATNPRPVRGLLPVYVKDDAGRLVLEDGKPIPELDEQGNPKREFYQGKVCEGLEITSQEAERLFDLDMDETEHGISALVNAPLSQSQFDCLVDFVHQFGLGALGGSTLITKVNKNPNNLGTPENDTGILHELMRWTRAGGEHQDYVWRRSARRCCIYNGTPIPQALWRKGGFPFVVTADDKIDYSITPTIYKIIEHGKKAAEPYKFDPSKPLPEPVAVAVHEPADELILETRAEPTKPVPNPAIKDQPRVSAEAAPATAPPSPPAPPVPLPPKLPDPPIPIGQQTSAVESAKKSEDWSVSAKAMWQSRRFWGLVLVMGGRLWMLKTGSNVVLGAVSDPLVTEMFSGFMVMIIGELVQHWGERKATRPLR